MQSRIRINVILLLSAAFVLLLTALALCQLSASAEVLVKAVLSTSHRLGSVEADHHGPRLAASASCASSGLDARADALDSAVENSRVKTTITRGEHNFQLLSTYFQPGSYIVKSAWKTPADGRRAGWNPSTPDYVCKEDVPEGVHSAMDVLGIKQCKIDHIPTGDQRQDTDASGKPQQFMTGWQRTVWEISGHKSSTAYGRYVDIHMPSEGMILSQSQSFPSKDRTKVVQAVPSGSDLMANHWSDAAYVSWLDTCMVLGLDPKPPRFILHVIDTDGLTLNIIGEVFRDSAEDAPQKNFHDAKVYRPTQPQFNALLGTTNGYAVAYFLAQHQQKFGLMSVTGITLWTPEHLRQRPCILFEIGKGSTDRSARLLSSRQRKRNELSSAATGISDRAVGHRSVSRRVRDVGNSTLAARIAAPARQQSRPSSFHEDMATSAAEDARDRGKSLQAQLAKSQTSQNKIVLAALKDNSAISNAKWLLTSKSKLKDDGVPSQTKDALTALGIVPKAYKHGTTPWSYQAYHLTAQKPAHGEGRYQTMYKPSKGTILSSDQEFPMADQVAGSAEATSVLATNHWSDVAYSGWADACKGSKIQTKKLNYVLVVVKSDRLTAQLVKDLSPGKTATKLPSYAKALVMSPGSTEYNTILGSPSGFGVAALLLQHQKELGVRQIMRIKLWNPGKYYPCLLFEIGKPSAWSRVQSWVHTSKSGNGARDLSCTPAPSAPELGAWPATYLETSHANLSEHLIQEKDPLKGAKARGQRLRGILANSKLEPDARGIVAAWTGVEAIKQHGWGRLVKPDVAQSFLPASIQGALESLGITQKPSSQRAKSQWTMYNYYSAARSGSGEYEYREMYNPVEATIVSVDQKYPWTGKFPTSESSQVDKYLFDNHWSDIMYISWASLCKQQNVSPKKIKQVLHVVTSDATTTSIVQSVVGAAIHTQYSSFQNAKKLTPGDHGFDEVLGTANGYGMAALLLQQQEELGARQIKRIKTWYCIGTVPCLLFEISAPGKMDRVKTWVKGHVGKSGHHGQNKAGDHAANRQ